MAKNATRSKMATHIDDNISTECKRNTLFHISEYAQSLYNILRHFLYTLKMIEVNISNKILL